MNRFIIAPDSFKGTMSSKQICEIIKERISCHYSSAQVNIVPIADGGEGSVDCFLSAVGGKLIKCESVNPLFEKMESFYGLINDGKTAIIEMASCAGLPLIEDRKNPLASTTYGVGLLVKDALSKGAKEIILGLGGSATNDFGCGFACALGVRFYDKDGNDFVPVGGTLCNIEKIDVTKVDSCVKKTKFTIMCDVKNPVYGENGAAKVYAPQKGATAEQVELLDKGLRHVCEIVSKNLGKDVSNVVGGGAAGAMAGGVVAFFSASIGMGIEVVLDTVGFDDMLENADVVFTGEGRLDSQSLQGKVIQGIVNRAKKKSVPVIAVVGGVQGDISSLYEQGVNSVFTINQLPEDLSISKNKSEENLRKTVDNILRILKI